MSIKVVSEWVHVRELQSVLLYLSSVTYSRKRMK